MELDIQQKEAVETESRKAMVISGAGSGKTRVLTERIAHLVENEKVSPFELMSFSFTRKSSGEMVKRLEDRIGKDVYGITTGTMHSIALSYIRRFGEFIGVKGNSLTVYNEWESNYLLREVAIDLGIYSKKKWSVPKKEVDKMFMAFYATGVEPLPEHKGYKLFKTFINRCKENNSVSYGSLLIGMRLLIPTLKQHLHIKHILVDEVQDIDPLQWKIINEMAEAFDASLFVVGDIDQSIYGFRGAVPEYLIEHQDEFDIYRIETNYRSDATIVNAANKLIEHNTERIEKTMRPIRAAKPSMFCIPDADTQGVITVYKSLISKTEPSRIAILCRVHGPLKKMSRLMTEQGVNHTYIGKKSELVKSEQFRRFHAFLKLMINPYDNFAFMLIRDIIGVSRETYNDIRLSAVRQSKSHFETWFEQGSSAEAARLLILTGDRDNIQCPAEYINDSWEWPEEIVKFIRESGKISIKDYLDYLATYDLQEEISEENEGVQLMTIHAAKGLEWPTVIIAGCNEGMLPSSQAIKANYLEDERRVAYTAWTRAEDRLILTVRPEVKDDKLTPISRFIKESRI